ncbi:MAG: AgmX/PglI C-terminal domain-containing protein [Fibrobacterota bacterium]
MSKTEINMRFNTAGEFPKEFRSSFVSEGSDRKFALIWLLCAVTGIALFVFLSSLEYKEEASQKEILEIQERYAKLVLNQEKQEEEAPPEQQEAVEEDAALEEEEKEDDIDREKESVVEKRMRKKATADSRRKKRAEARRAIEKTGVFAALTAVGGGAGGAEEILGADVGGISDVLKDDDLAEGGFAGKRDIAGGLAERRGAVAAGGRIERSKLRKAKSEKYAAGGDINLSRKDQAAESRTKKSSGARTQSSIQKNIRRLKIRLERLFERYLKKDPSLSGKIVVSFVILPDGVTSDIKIASSTLDNREFADKVKYYVSRTRFDAVPGADPLKVTLPLAFSGVR